jgi:hypothetical protein
MTATIRIGGACAFVGDSILGPRQLCRVDGMQYLVFDYLAEMTLSSFAQARKLDPAAGYATEFVEVVLREILPECLARGIRLVANAGGLQPEACARAIEALGRELGCTPRVAFVTGDDASALLPSLRAAGVPDFYDGSPMPPQVDSANVYLGALPVARALAMGADVVVTGRVVDSATTLGILMHAFGWPPDAHDLLAAGSLAGHILECGAQATGGIFTDWAQVPDWENIGYPIVDCAADGSFVVSKPPGTGGLLTVATVSEQILYEVGDPACYILPDVTCDFTGVQVVQDGVDRVRVSGARGTEPPASYKLSASYQQGFRCVAQLSVFGIDAVAKARRTGQALLARVQRMLRDGGFADFDKAAVTVIGAEDGYGPHAVVPALREAIARVAVTHAERAALELFSREARAPGVSFAPGTTSGSALTLNGRAAVEPRARLYSCLVDKAALPAPRVHCGGGVEEAPVPLGGWSQPPSLAVGEASARAVQGQNAVAGKAAALQDAQATASPAPTSALTRAHTGAPSSASSRLTSQVPLIALAHGRSGDKGDTSNVAIIARRPEWVALLREELTAERVKDWLGHLVHGSVTRYEVPGLHAFNFHLTGALDGGGPSSLRTDPMGKGMAQMLLEMPVRAP